MPVVHGRMIFLEKKMKIKRNNVFKDVEKKKKTVMDFTLEISGDLLKHIRY